jgi:hypothetical protein
MKKTKRDIDAERYANLVTGSVKYPGVSVTGGGSKGPYQLTIYYLNKKTLAQVIRAIDALDP